MIAPAEGELKGGDGLLGQVVDRGNDAVLVVEREPAHKLDARCIVGRAKLRLDVDVGELADGRLLAEVGVAGERVREHGRVERHGADGARVRAGVVLWRELPELRGAAEREAVGSARDLPGEGEASGRVTTVVLGFAETRGSLNTPKRTVTFDAVVTSGLVSVVEYSTLGANGAVAQSVRR